MRQARTTGVAPAVVRLREDDECPTRCAPARRGPWAAREAVQTRPIAHVAAEMGVSCACENLPVPESFENVAGLDVQGVVDGHAVLVDHERC